MASTQRYVRRIIDDELDDIMTGLPAIALVGAKGVGKTATASQRANRTVRLDVDAERAAFAASGFDLEPQGTLLIDEWQRYPPCWDQVRRAVDAGAPAGSFILAGSAAPKSATIHSGAGRIVPRRLRPLSVAERGIGQASVSLSAFLSGSRAAVDGETRVGLADYVDEIFASGFPGLRSLSERFRAEAVDGYIANTVEREFAEQGIRVRRPASLMAWLRAFAAATATTTSYSSILDAATAGVSEKPGRDTTLVYRDTLARGYVLDSLEAWVPTANALKRLTVSPKHFLADPALAARLLGLGREAVLSGTDHVGSPLVPGSMLGPLFEHLAVQSIVVYAEACQARVGHLRQQDGRHEIDVIVERADRGVVAIEVKLATVPDPQDAKHLHWLGEQIGPRLLDKVIVTTGPRAYRSSDGVAVVPLALLGP
ncbi:MAG: DUF4143 domain-containing protein [Propionibacteriaceae bacterium]|jgi:predicted AAA+ superfamily ATPase|nr:DUF4143 domain-containing protein [Propionibacteriaceae bacterium]